MKTPARIARGSLLAIAVQLVVSGCIGPSGAVYGGGVIYGGDPWFEDDVWIDGGGHGWYRGHDREVYVHPGGRGRREDDRHRR